MTDTRLERWQQALVKQGVRLTPQREVILSYLAQTRAHPTAAQVYAAVRERFPHVSRATVYNTLNLMAQLGLIAELRREEGSIRYETDLSPHINLICLRCGQVEDVDIEELMSARVDGRTPADVLQERNGFQVLYVRVDFYGYCARCRQEMSRTERGTVTVLDQEQEEVSDQ